MTEHKFLKKAGIGFLVNDGSLPSFPTQRCTLHPNKVVDMFCKNHDEVACSSCMFLSHRTCPQVHSIPEEVDNLYNKTELADTMQRVENSKKALEKNRKANENTVKELKELSEKEIESVKSFRQELQTILENIEQRTVTELRNEHDRIESVLTSETHEINKLINALNERHSELTKTARNKAQEFVSIKSSAKMTMKAEDMRKELQSSTDDTFSFTADQNIKKFLQEIQVLGKVSCNKNRITETNNRLFKVKHQREIQIKLASDISDCNVHGSCITDAGFLLLTDFNNKNIKRLNMLTETVHDYISLPNRPLGITIVSKTEAAVAMINNTVQFLSLGNELIATRTLKMNHDCFYLAHEDGNLFISATGIKCIFMT